MNKSTIWGLLVILLIGLFISGYTLTGCSKEEAIHVDYYSITVDNRSSVPIDIVSDDQLIETLKPIGVTRFPVADFSENIQFRWIDFVGDYYIQDFPLKKDDNTRIKKIYITNDKEDRAIICFNTITLKYELLFSDGSVRSFSIDKKGVNKLNAYF